MQTATLAMSKNAALRWLVENSPVVVASYTELAEQFGWERARCWKIVQEWKRKGFVETSTAPDNGSLTVSIVPNVLPLDVSEADSSGESISVREEAPTLPTAPEGRSQPPGAPNGSRSAPLKQQHSEAATETVYAHVVDRPRVENAPMDGLDAGLCAVALALTGIAAYFSITGMTVLFPGAAQAIVAFGIIAETAKFLGVAWLAKNASATPWAWRFVAAALLLNVAVINMAGVYSQLTAAHVGERGAAAASRDTADAEATARIEVAQGRLTDIDKRIAAIDAVAEGAAKRGKANTARDAMKGQSKDRAALEGQREQAAKELADLKAKRAGLSAQGRAAESEATPIRYVAQLLGIQADPETVIRVLIAMIVLSGDPLALVLTGMVAARRKGRA